MISAAESGVISAAESGVISAAESFEESPKPASGDRDGAQHGAQHGAQDGAGADTWAAFEASGDRDGAQHGAQDGAGADTWAAFEADRPKPLHEDARPATAATERCSERATELPVYLLFANHVGNAPSPAHLMASDDRTHCP